MNHKYRKKAYIIFHNSISFLEKFKAFVNTIYIANLRTWGRFFYTLSGIASAIILILEFGFFYPDSWIEFISIIVNIIINYLLFYEIAAFIFTSSKFWKYFKTHLVEFSIIVIVLLQKFFKDDILNYLAPEKAGLLFLSITQAFFLFSNFSHLIRNTKFYDVKKFSPSTIFVGSFAFIILLGSILLHLPKAITKSIPSIDIFFTAVSATCVTGLTTINISESFTFTGQIILILLMQAGGLGIMTLASFFGIFLTGKTSVSDKLLMKDLLSEQSIGEVKYLLARIALFSFAIEGMGAIFMYFSIPESLTSSIFDRVFLSIFHSVSAFCNAGFSLFPDGFATIEIFQSKKFLSISMILITLGGVGFPLLSQTYKKILNPRNPRIRYSVSARIVLITSGILFLLGTISFLFIEMNNSLKGMAFFDKIFHSMFYSVTLRTAGFNSVNMSYLSESIVFFSLFFMWVGASPTSTGGGIKTTTFFIALLNIWLNFRGKKNVEFSKRTISRNSISRASATIVLSFFVIFTSLFLLTFSEENDFLDLAFEIVSAYGTVGLSRGLTENLSIFGKIVIMMVMFIGRVGVFNLALVMIKEQEVSNYEYPIEEVVVS
ncbi:MAG: portal protein [Leptospira sp.]|nr:portal protein [Leptospira sp.]NCS94668.1 portal protein [Leptospira sp.]